jgi:ribosomal protein S27E
LPVPELTRSTDIQLNDQLSLRARADALASPQPDNAQPPRSAWQSRQIILILPGGFISAGLWFQVLGFEQVMTISRAAQVTQAPIRHSRFRIVCINCDSLGIVFDCPEGAPPSTQIKCRNCGAPRGTLGELRELSCSDRRDLFEV